MGKLIFSNSGRHSMYDDVTVCKDWLTFSNFKAWMIVDTGDCCGSV